MADCCASGPTINGVPPGVPSGGVSPAQYADGIVLWEADLTAQTPVAFADGPQNIVGIDGRSLGFTVANTAGAASGTPANWGLDASGLNWLANGTSTTWTTASTTASRLSIPYIDLQTAFDFDLTRNVIFEARYTLFSWSAGTPDACISMFGQTGAPSNSSIRIYGIKRALRAATQVSLGIANADQTNYTTAPGGTADVLALQLNGPSWRGMIGVWSSGWPRYRAAPIMGNNPTTGNVNNPEDGCSFTMSFASNSLAGTSRVRMDRLRIRILAA